MIEISIDDQLTPQLQAAAAALSNRRSLMLRVGNRVAKDLRAHFRDRNSKPNKRGWPKQGFWADMVRATDVTSATDDEAVVTVADPRLNLKIYGDRITPKRGRALAEPNTAAAYAAGSPREGGTPELTSILFKIPRGKGNVVGALIEKAAEPVGGTGKKTVSAIGSSLGGPVWYWLTAWEDIPKDPDALPPNGELERAVGEEAEAWINAAMIGKARAT